MTGLPSSIRRLATAAAIGALVVAAAPPAGAQARVGSHDLRVRTVATFRGGMTVFPESLVLGRDHALYASVTVWGARANTGRVVRITTDGTKQAFGPTLHLGPTGMLTGIVYGGWNRIYVAEADFGSGHSHIYRVQPHGLTTWATLPVGTFPNGLVLRDGWLFAADSYLGAVWRPPGGHPAVLTTPWFRSPLLAPTSALGANGLAFWGDHLYVSVSDRGSIVRADVGRAGRVYAVRTVRADPRLVTVDGITFDRAGRLWLVVNGNGSVPASLDRLTRGGELTPVLTAKRWMAYPTQPVSLGRTVFVENGAFDGGTPSVVAVTFAPLSAAGPAANR